MANTPKKLYAGQASTSAITLYTTPAATKTIVKNIVIGNTTSVSATISIIFATNPLISAYTVAPNDTVTIDLSLVLETGDAISGYQGTAGALRLHISGVEVV